MNAGTVYLLHFDRPYKHARHYTGWALDLDTRLALHAQGHGARLLAVIRDAGIGWQLARTWPGDRHRERQLKNQGGATRHCPLCGIHPRQTDPGGQPPTPPPGRPATPTDHQTEGDTDPWAQPPDPALS